MNETDQVGGAPAADPGEPPARPGPWARKRSARPRRSSVLLYGGALLGGIAFATVFAFAVTRLHARNEDRLGRADRFRPTGIPASVSTSLADMMQLSPVPPVTAPGFTLTDQSGRQVSLASFRGSTVVLTFMDSHCTDICPLVSREFIDAHRELGSTARRVVFVA